MNEIGRIVYKIEVERLSGLNIKSINSIDYKDVTAREIVVSTANLVNGVLKRLENEHMPFEFLKKQFLKEFEK